MTESPKSNDLGDVMVGKVWSGSNLARSDSGFGGSEDQSQTIEEPFGPLEDLTDAVFEDMFSPSKRTTCAVAEPPLPRSLKSTTTRPAVGGPKTFWEDQRAGDLKKRSPTSKFT